MYFWMARTNRTYVANCKRDVVDLKKKHLHINNL